MACTGGICGGVVIDLVLPNRLFSWAERHVSKANRSPSEERTGFQLGVALTPNLLEIKVISILVLLVDTLVSVIRLFSAPGVFL
ncbi:hypothetical protein LDENG_00089550 [Lucifuga dentata]|nr:hypothetical protein LDENG_00089550 [Lucifuga dentata]